MRSGPARRARRDVFVHAFEDRPTQLELGIDFVNGRRPLQVERGVILRHGVLAVGLLAHFDVSDAIAAFLDVGDLRRRIVRRAVKHGDRNHRRKVVGQSAGEKKIEAAVLVAAAIVYVFGGVPGINRRNAIGRSSFRRISLLLPRRRRCYQPCRLRIC